MRSKLLGVLVVVAVGCGAFATAAGAAVRYAAPGGSGPSPCLQADPCSFFSAASTNAGGQRAIPGDEVVLLPGVYAGSKGDLGPKESISLETHLTVRGPAGGRARIESAATGRVLELVGYDVVSDLEVVGTRSSEALVDGLDSRAERVVARDWGEAGLTCHVGVKAVLRDSACISHGPDGVAVGSPYSSNLASELRSIRSVTAIADGEGSTGMLFVANGGGEVIVDVKSSIARGAAEDIEARGEGSGDNAAILLEHSDYAMTKEVSTREGIGFVTRPGFNGNITESPLLAANGYHELSGSPTVDDGIVDGSSGSADVDGQLRTIGSAPDIGADELAHTTSVVATCPEAAVDSGPKVSCPITVTDTSSGGTAPTGIVELKGPGGSTDGTCILVAVDAISSRCEAGFAGGSTVPGSYRLRVDYHGDGTHDGSEGEAPVVVDPAPSSSSPTVTTPPVAGQSVIEAPLTCKVPNLTGSTLRAAKKKLRAAHCKLGKVRKLGAATAGTGKVKAQAPKPKATLAAGAKVDITLTPAGGHAAPSR